MSTFSQEYLGNISSSDLFGSQTYDYNGGVKNGPALFQWLRYRQPGNRTDLTSPLSRMTSMNAIMTDQVQQRPNLLTKTNSPVLRILFDDNKKAIGIEYLCHGDQIIRAYAKKEIILAAGAFATPQLLQVCYLFLKKGIALIIRRIQCTFLSR